MIRNHHRIGIPIAITIILVAPFCHAQDAFKFHYEFGTIMNGRGNVIEEIPSVGGATYRALDLSDAIKMGKIQINEGHDTLKLVPWYFTRPGIPPNVLVQLLPLPAGTLRPVTEGNSYTFHIDWTTTATLHHGYRYFDIPFTYSQFVVTSLPFRIDLKTGAFKPEFLNANISYMFISGRTRFYKSKFLSPRNSYWGFGPYVGASTVQDDDKNDHFGFNYGLNGVRSVRNINVILAVGAESSFISKSNSFTPYVGIGLGLKLIEFYEPTTEEK